MNTLVLFALLFFCMAIGMPIAISLGLSSIITIVFFSQDSLASLTIKMFETSEHYTLMSIPFFVLAGVLMSTGGVAKRMVNFAIAAVGHLRGGLAIASVLACMLFAAVSGSSPATVVAIGSIVIAGMVRNGYTKEFAAGVICNAGTLGILIPPSIVLAIDAILAEQYIAKLFLAAFVPGILAAIGYMIAISIYVRLYPESAGQSPRMPYGQRFRALVDVWPVLLVFFAVVGGIYFGWFTPTEGAAIGAAGTGLIAWVNGGLTRQTLIESVLLTASATGMIFFIVFGAAMYNGFLALTQLPQIAAATISGQGFNPWIVMVSILVLYLILGCVMDSLSMILLTIPIFFPIVSALDYGLGPEEFAIWFGILVLIVVEVGLITPPVGMNLFVINSMAKDTPIVQTYRGVTPFVISDLVRTTILVIFPAISLFLLRWLY